MSKSKSIHFFATKCDLESLLAAVESQRRIKYTQAGMFDSPEMKTFTSGLQIPNLGLSTCGDSNGEPFWLITDVDAKIEMKVIPQRRGGNRYGVDNGLNHDSIIIWPGGVFENSCVIMGTIGTGLINPTSMELLNLFVREIRRQFKRIKSSYVGPEAEQLLDSGYRLTHGVKTAKTSDLSKS